ncbi:tRNA pseudouridine(38-40) synthase TruA [Rudanella lutea]|uniref:tRNA pseudouridine(38-40) synthase TruA n=1 Tax=Rudanella lutea TaxID=451374 RepID=UPI00037D51A2|nr:tRNA pseudouridine(38-40) synthase TruA [Rudanella lutea]
MELAYCGTQYHGWQIQANGHSVQSEIEGALSRRLRQPVSILGSGRTDAGVHAHQQYAHFDLPEPLDDLEQITYSLNAMLPPDIAIRRIFPVQPDDHARFSAISRYYQYRITRQKDAFRHMQSYYFRYPLDMEAMNQAARVLLEHTDYQSFSRAKAAVKHFHCTIDRAEWLPETGDDLTFHIRANRFLWGMVRAIVGTLLEVGQGRMTTEEFEQIILARDRRAAGRAAPASGLFLFEVGYPAGIV